MRLTSEQIRIKLKTANDVKNPPKNNVIGAINRPIVNWKLEAAIY